MNNKYECHYITPPAPTVLDVVNEMLGPLNMMSRACCSGKSFGSCLCKICGYCLSSDFWVSCWWYLCRSYGYVMMWGWCLWYPSVLALADQYRWCPAILWVIWWNVLSVRFDDREWAVVLVLRGRRISLAGDRLVTTVVPRRVAGILWIQ